jgi:hypothetical protein
VIRLLAYLFIWIFQEYRAQKHNDETRVRKLRMDRVRDDLDYCRDRRRGNDGHEDGRRRRYVEDEEPDDEDSDRPRRRYEQAASSGSLLLKSLLIVGGSVAAGALLIGALVLGLVAASNVRKPPPVLPPVVGGPNPPVVPPGADGGPGIPPAAAGKQPGEFLRIRTGGRAVAHTRFSPDGQTLATVGQNSVCQLWDATTGEGKASFHGDKPDYVNWLTFSPDGKYVAAYDGGGNLRLRDAATGAVRTEIDPGGADGYNHGCFAPQSDYFVLVSGPTIRFWSVPDGKLLDRFKNVQPDKQASYTSALLTPDGKTLITGARRAGATGHGRFDQVWDLTGDKPVRQLKGLDPTNIWGRLTLSADGKLVMLQSTARIELLDWTVDRLVTTLTVAPGTEAFSGAAMTPDGAAVVAGYNNGSVRRWQLPAGVESGRFQAGQPTESVVGLAVSPDGKLLATAVGDRLTVWQCNEVFAKK